MHHTLDPEALRDHVVAEIAKTEKIIGEYREMTRPVSPDVAIGRLSRMDAMQQTSVAESAMREAEVKLKNLKSVLSRYGTPEFGLCRKCRQPIPIGRILIRPQSLYCVRCAD